MTRYRPTAQYGRCVLFLKCAVTVRVRDRVTIRNLKRSEKFGREFSANRIVARVYLHRFSF